VEAVKVPALELLLNQHNWVDFVTVTVQRHKVVTHKTVLLIVLGDHGLKDHVQFHVEVVKVPALELLLNQLNLVDLVMVTVQQHKIVTHRLVL